MRDSVCELSLSSFASKPKLSTVDTTKRNFLFLWPVNTNQLQNHRYRLLRERRFLDQLNNQTSDQHAL